MRTKQTTGQGAVEFALILLLIAVGTLIAAQLMGVTLNDVFCRVGAGFDPDDCGPASAQTGAQVGVATSAAPYCVDTFNSQGESENQNGKWKKENGKACIQGAGNMINECSVNNMKASDYTAQVGKGAVNEGNGYGIYFRASNSGDGINGYAFQYDPEKDSFVIRKWVNGREIYPSVVEKAVPGYNWHGNAHDLSVKVIGNTFTGMVDGQPVITGRDSTYTSGGAGIRTWDEHTRFCMDSFSVNPIAP